MSVERIPQSVARRVELKAYLSTDHLSAATGKTIAITISKNGGAFGNPSAGATNATEIGSGWYYVDLSTTDTGTTGPLIVRGTASGVDDVEDRFTVSNAHNAGFDGVPNAVAGAAGGLPTGDASGRVDVGKVLGTAQTAGDLVALLATIASYIDTEIATLLTRLGVPSSSIAAQVADIQSRLPAALSGAGYIKADIKEVNDVEITGTGVEDTDEWRPA